MSRQGTHRTSETASPAQARLGAEAGAALARALGSGSVSRSEQSHQLVLIVDDTGLCLTVLGSLETPHLPPAQTIPGQRLSQIFPAGIARRFVAAIEAARRSGVPETLDFRRGSGAGRRHYDVRITPPGPTGVAALRLRERADGHGQADQFTLIAQIMAQMTNLVLVLDGENRVLWANPAFEAVSGWPLEAMRGKTPADRLVGSRTDRRVLRDLVASLASQGAARAEIELQARDGASFWVDVALQPLQGPDAQSRRRLVVMTDISDRKRQEAELRRLAGEAADHHRRLQEAVESLNDGFVLFDPDDRMVICNRRYREINAGIADLIVPGVTQQTLIRAGLERGMYDTVEGDPAEEDSLFRALHEPAFAATLRYRDGRLIAVHSMRMADGSLVGLRSDITLIRHAEQRLNDIIRGAGVGAWERDLLEDTLVVNDQWFAMLGHEPDGIRIADPCVRAQLIHPEDGPRVRRELAQVREGRTDQVASEFRLRHREGHWVHILSLGRLLSHDPAGRPHRMSGIDIDITARRQAEERLSAILGAATVGTWQLDWTADRLTIDDAYAKMLGFKREALAPFDLSKFQSMVHPDDLDRMHARTAALKETGEDRMTHEFRMRHHDGRWVWILSQARILRWAQPGIPAEESGVHIDITEAKMREFALAEAKAALEAALEARRDAEQRIADIAEVSEEWFWEWDENHRLTYISSGFERATGTPREKVLGTAKADRERFGVEVASGMERLSEIIDAREPFSDLILRMRHAVTGEPLWIRLNGAPHFNPRGQFIGYRGVGTNVTALVAASERAEAASQAKSRFLANMSHELRTPMTGVLGMAELLAEAITDPDLRGMVESIRASGEELMVILNDILDLAKIEAGKMSLETQPFAPAELARRVEMLFAPQAEVRGLKLRMRTDGGCNRLREGDPHRILQILNNLVGNALKFTEKGTIDIELACSDPDTLRIDVVDTGIGMTPEQARRAFDDFEQAEASTGRRFGGTGLGLTITRGLVTLMGGAITLESELGIGTRATVTLPLPRSMPQRDLAAADRPMLSGLRLLVADDTETNRAILKRMLEDEGIAATVVEDGCSAVRAFRPAAFDLLLIDISMPVLDGIDALAAIRDQENAAGAATTPALAVTANAMTHQVEDYAAAGFAGHLAKPFRKAELLRVIAAHALPHRRAAG